MEWIIAIATVFIAFFTALLWCSTDRLWKTANKSINLAREEFIATHPPKIRVHSIYLKEGTIPPFSGIHNRPWDIQCFIDNIGGSTATIKESNLTFKKLKDPLPAILPFSDECHKVTENPIAPGESTIGLLTIDVETVESFRNYISTKHFRDNINQVQMKTGTETEAFYFFGYIDYLDNLGIIRRTAFCRRYNIETKRFTKVKDEDYEYSY